MIGEVDRLEQAALPAMTADEARAAAGKIRLSVGDLRRLLLDFEERRGYQALGYQNMRLCAEHEFGWPKSQFYRQLKAIDVERSVGVAIGDMPESHARELARLPAADRAEAYTAAGDGATAAEVRAEVERRLPREEPLPEPEPFAPLGEPGTSATAFNTDLPTDDDPAPLCHNCGEPVPGGIEDGLPVICEKCAPGYYGEDDAETEPEADAGSRADAGQGQASAEVLLRHARSKEGEGDGAGVSHCDECGRETPDEDCVDDRGVIVCRECYEARSVAVTETVGSIPPVVSDLSKPGRDSDASSASRHSQDPPAPQSAVGIEDDEAWLVALLERRWLLENGLPTPKLVRLARIVTARAGDRTRAGQVARAMLAEAKE